MFSKGSLVMIDASNTLKGSLSVVGGELSLKGKYFEPGIGGLYLMFFF